MKRVKAKTTKNALETKHPKCSTSTVKEEGDRFPPGEDDVQRLLQKVAVSQRAQQELRRLMLQHHLYMT